ncbi:unnamed protein product [Prunus brigantina]
MMAFTNFEISKVINGSSPLYALLKFKTFMEIVKFA